MSQTQRNNIQDKAQSEQNQSVQNKEENIQVSVEEQKKRRRKRADQDGRNFLCSCGKSYLSYPALYTHIKTKHPQSEKLKNQKQIQQGGNQTKRQVQQKNQNQNPDASQNEPSREIIFDFSKFKQFLQRNYSKNKTCTFLSYIRNSFALTEKQRSYIDSIKELVKNKQQSQDSQMEVKDGTIDQAFAKFLAQMSKYCNFTCKLALDYFISALHQHLLEVHGQNYTQQTSATFLPENLNQFVLKFIQSKNNNNMNQPIVICKIVFYFCRWLYKQKYTQELIRFNQVKKTNLSNSQNSKTFQQNRQENQEK